MTMPFSCKDCKWWWGEPVSCLDGRRLCNPPGLVDAVNDAVGIDGEYATATVIFTGPDFGCIHWKAKDGR